MLWVTSFGSVVVKANTSWSTSSSEEQADDEANHPNADNVVSPDDPNVGPAPTSDPRGKAGSTPLRLNTTTRSPAL